MIDRPAAQRQIRALMTPVDELVWLDLQDPTAARDKIAVHPHSVFPVMDGRPEALFGIIEAKDLLSAGYLAEPLDLRGLSKPPLLVPEIAPVLKALGLFARYRERFALVTDQKNDLTGLLALSDVVVAAMGHAERDPARGRDPWIVQRQDGSWLVDGMVPVTELYALVESAGPPERAKQLQTVAGLVLDRVGRLPKSADTVDLGTFTIEVVDMDDWRIDKVLVTRPRSTP